MISDSDGMECKINPRENSFRTEKYLIALQNRIT
jgi:hypothetical protein